jgi:hypothetical protein
MKRTKLTRADKQAVARINKGSAAPQDEVLKKILMSLLAAVVAAVAITYVIP